MALLLVSSIFQPGLQKAELRFLYPDCKLQWRLLPYKASLVNKRMYNKEGTEI
jgi:hypothetical protein